ncbi:MAG: restriction endonuclease [Burkholderiales bacterium]|jgi:restriction system protein|nr:restriction endonuclease [Burkholderiales bacterium]
MAIPNFVKLMHPLLRLMSDGEEHFRRDVVEKLAKHFNLTDDERKELLPSGQTVFDNRVGWTRIHLIKAGLLAAPRRGVMCITPLGKQILSENPATIDFSFLERFPGFVEFRTSSRSKKTTVSETPPAETEQTPEEALVTAYQSLRDSLADDLLGHVRKCGPTFFENLVIELLVKMGYGGSRQDASKHLGRGGDGGVDGIINEDRLGLDVVYIQAKRWEKNISSPEIRDFVGALEGKRAMKGVFITTSSYTKEALKYVSQLSTKKVVLIDGVQLASLMIDFDIGVSTVSSYDIKRIDSDYFEED